MREILYLNSAYYASQIILNVNFKALCSLEFNLKTNKMKRSIQ